LLLLLLLCVLSRAAVGAMDLLQRCSIDIGNYGALVGIGKTARRCTSMCTHVQGYIADISTSLHAATSGGEVPPIVTLAIKTEQKLFDDGNFTAKT
jgi:hypothetical protein